MKMRNLLLLMLCLLLMPSGCSSEQVPSNAVTAEYLYERAEASQNGGHFFFAGEVLSVMTDAKQITYYEEQTAKNTFYQVEVTNDLFGCMPDRVITVCVLGTSEHFVDRFPLEEGEEYLFDTTLWVHGGAAVFLLPTFYENLPQISGDSLYYTDDSGKYLLDVDYEAYTVRLTEMAKETGYGAQKVLAAVKERLELAAKDRTVEHFEKAEFEKPDQELIKGVNRDAAALLRKAEKAPESWSGIEEFLR